MRRLTKMERALLAAVASAGAAVVMKTIRLINVKKDYIISKSAGDADPINTGESSTAESTEEKE